nr:ribonuclease H-like domain-containing protein [Tanacetum cinerariifolium]
MTSDDVVTFALEGLPARYKNISTIIAHRYPFSDLKTVRSMLTTKEMQMKSRVQHTLVETRHPHRWFYWKISILILVAPPSPRKRTSKLIGFCSAVIALDLSILLQIPRQYLSRYKARLVANGSTQIEGIDVDETFSPVIKPGTIQTVLSLALSRHWPVHQLDVNNAFLYGDLTETVYMHQLPGFQDPTHPDYRKYATEILKQAHMANCNPSRTPVDTESKLGDDGDQVCLHMHDPREPHFSALKRILRYVRGTLDYGLQLFSSSTSSLVAYSDADWAGCPTTRRSTSGYCVFLGNNFLSWSAKRQPTLSRSSAEAEYRGVANAVAKTCWLRNLLRELHTPLSSATLVCYDNVSAVYVSSNPVQHQRTKHIAIDIRFVQDLVATGQVRVLHVPSRYQYADIFTKCLPTTLFGEFRSSLSVRCPLAQTAKEC